MTIWVYPEYGVGCVVDGKLCHLERFLRPLPFADVLDRRTNALDVVLFIKNEAILNQDRKGRSVLPQIGTSQFHSGREPPVQFRKDSFLCFLRFHTELPHRLTNHLLGRITQHF